MLHTSHIESDYNVPNTADKHVAFCTCGWSSGHYLAYNGADVALRIHYRTCRHVHQTGKRAGVLPPDSPCVFCGELPDHDNHQDGA